MSSPRPRILLVEDDRRTSEEIAAALADHGIDTDCVRCGGDVRLRVADDAFDAVILDRLLADGVDGLSVVADLRARGVGVPIMVLSALSAVGDRVQGLEAGCDDYLVKPFEFIELTARVDALLRRSGVSARPAARLQVGDLTFDLIGRSVERGGRPVELLPREARLLEFLMRHEGEVLTRAMIFEAVWGYRFNDRSNTIDVHIGGLRRKLEQYGAPMIHTIRQAGYILRASH